jgi:hypothetical protein
MLTAYAHEQFKVGDKVGICRHYYGDLAHAEFGQVVKINHRHGHVHVQVWREHLGGPLTMVFDKRGNERDGRNYLMDVESLQKQIDRRDQEKNRQKAVQAILDCVASHRCGNGRFHINAETKAELFRLVNAIESEVE